MPDPAYLPRLKDTGLRPSDRHVWDAHPAGLPALAEYSRAMDVDVADDVRAEELKSVPSPWARLLLFEQALSSVSHPAHPQVVQEWRGLLGCIALAKYNRASLRVERLSMSELGGPAAALNAMLPLDQAAESPERQASWSDFGLIYLAESDSARVLVGGTSPRTLVFTGIRSLASGKPPFQDRGRLTDPAAYYLRHKDHVALRLLEVWLDKTIRALQKEENALDQFLGSQPAGRAANAVRRSSILFERLENWLHDTRAALQQVTAEVGRDLNFGAGDLDTESVFAGFGTPLAILAPLVPPADITAVAPQQSDLWSEDLLCVVDPSSGILIDASGQPYDGDVFLPSGNARSVRKGRFTLPTTGVELGKADAPDLGRFFTDQLIQVETATEDNTRVLRPPHAGEKAAYLYPFDPGILDTLKPDQLIDPKWCWIPEGGGAITVRLEVPLRRSDLKVRYQREYSGRGVVKNYIAPQLLSWPNFTAPDWKYHFYYARRVAAPGKPGLEVDPVAEVEATCESEDGSRTWGRLREPARAWICRAGSGAGLLLTPPAGGPKKERSAWHVSVDFGSTHTRVYYRDSADKEDQPHALAFRARAVPLLSRAVEDCFFAHHGGPEQINPDVEEINPDVEELKSIIVSPSQKLRDSRRNGKSPWMPSDGVIYWGDDVGGVSGNVLKHNLKWHENDDDRQAFSSCLNHLYLLVKAEATARGAEIKDIATAFPSAFPNNLRDQHKGKWDSIYVDYGVTIAPSVSESVAVANYFHRSSGTGALVGVNFLAVDVGGSTADLQVRIGETTPGDSVRFAGELLSRLITTSPAARAAVAKAAKADPIRVPLSWDEPHLAGLKFNSLLRTIAKKHGTIAPLGTCLGYDGPGSDGYMVLGHAGYLFATLSYLMGLLVRRHIADDTSLQSIDRLELYFAGHGAEYLRWLDVFQDGAARTVPERFFLGALEMDRPVSVTAATSPELKQEVGKGLLYHDIGDKRAAGSMHSTFVAETGFDRLLGAWNEELSVNRLGDTKEEPPAVPTSLSQFQMLQRFVDLFWSDGAARSIGEAIGLRRHALADEALRDRVHQRLFGEGSAWSLVKGGKGDRALVEPLFVVEARALLEHATRNFELFPPQP